MQIVNFVSCRLSSKEIANAIHLTSKTVEVHRHNILKKLKLKNSGNLANFMYLNAGYRL
jgi:DNA-binding NarL/FixJ family response regulator